MWGGQRRPSAGPMTSSARPHRPAQPSRACRKGKKMWVRRANLPYRCSFRSSAGSRPTALGKVRIEDIYNTDQYREVARRMKTETKQVHVLRPHRVIWRAQNVGEASRVLHAERPSISAREGQGLPYDGDSQAEFRNTCACASVAIALPQIVDPFGKDIIALACARRDVRVCCQLENNHDFARSEHIIDLHPIAG
jgi:hypothetical protein